MSNKKGRLLLLQENNYFGSRYTDFIVERTHYRIPGKKFRLDQFSSFLLDALYSVQQCIVRNS